MTNKEFIREAVTSVLVQKNPDAIEKYWSPNYLQHSPVVPDGRQAVIDMNRILFKAPNLNIKFFES